MLHSSADRGLWRRILSRILLLRSAVTAQGISLETSPNVSDMLDQLDAGFTHTWSRACGERHVGSEPLERVQ